MRYLTVWGFQTGWIDVALAGLLIIAPTAAATVQVRMGAIAQLARATPDGPLLVALLARIHDPALWLMPQTATTLLLGIVFLMTNKPDLPSSLLVMAIALVAGLVPWLLIVRCPRLGGAQVVVADTARPAGPAT
jgi:hypothetical protein